MSSLVALHVFGVTLFPAIPSAFSFTRATSLSLLYPLLFCIGSIATSGKRGSEDTDAEWCMQFGNTCYTRTRLLVLPTALFAGIPCHCDHVTDHNAQVNNVIIAGNDDQDF